MSDSIDDLVDGFKVSLESKISAVSSIKNNEEGRELVSNVIYSELTSIMDQINAGHQDIKDMLDSL